MPSAFSVTVLQMNKRTLLLLFSVSAARMKLSVTVNYPLECSSRDFVCMATSLSMSPTMVARKWQPSPNSHHTSFHDTTLFPQFMTTPHLNRITLLLHWRERSVVSWKELKKCGVNWAKAVTYGQTMWQRFWS